jgi:hypothetical protein
MRRVFVGTLVAVAVAMAAPAFATDDRSTCTNCVAPRPHYDSTEVVQTSRDVDHSRTINTTSVVEVPPKVRTTNHLVLRKNTIRNVGTIQHNHTIIEKEIRYRRPVQKTPAKTKFIMQGYRTVYQPTVVYVPVVYPMRYAVPYHYDLKQVHPQPYVQPHHYQQYYQPQQHYQPQQYYQPQPYCRGLFCG